MVSQARAASTHVDVRDVTIPLAKLALRGNLALPRDTRGLVIFAHGSGSGRHSPRNRYVADVLQKHGLGTLLIDLLTPDEQHTDRLSPGLRFDIPLLAGRLAGVGEWVWLQSDLRELDCAYFGASTGAAAALIAAAGQYRIRTLVARGGRPDLAGAVLARVNAPVLLLVGSRDHEVLKLNERALRVLNDDSRLDVIPRASHLFEEPGTLEDVAQRAAQWFLRYLG